MKTLIFFFLLTATYFSQVRVWSANIDTTGETVYKSCENPHSIWYFTVALIDSGDTIKIYGGTNQPDTAVASEKYSQLYLQDIADSSGHSNVITGDEAWHTYIILNQDRRKNIKLEATAIDDTTAYIIEVY